MRYGTHRLRERLVDAFDAVGNGPAQRRVDSDSQTLCITPRIR